MKEKTGSTLQEDRVVGEAVSPIGIRPAGVMDVPEIKALIDANVKSGLLLPKPLYSLYEGIRDFKVCVDGGKVVGVGALHVVWEDLAEIRSVAIAESHQSKGIGKRLIVELLREAEFLGIKRVFALTYATRFFFSLGFRETDKQLLPHKIWADCIHCAKFPACDEVAVIRELGAGAALEALPPREEIRT
jgi:amino-acid N-acetyltransferase